MITSDNIIKLLALFWGERIHHMEKDLQISHRYISFPYFTPNLESPSLSPIDPALDRDWPTPLALVATQHDEMEAIYNEIGPVEAQHPCCYAPLCR